MKLYELFKGAEYVGEFTLDEIISITGSTSERTTQQRSAWRPRK